MPFFIVEDLPVQEPMSGFKGKFVHSENMSVAQWRIGRNSMAPLHAHPHEQVTMVVEGEFELTIAGETKVVKPGVVAVVPPNVEHSGIAITDCLLIDIFHPVREEYRMT
jgi:quercetin dioxygenase-like cupin family protein